MTPLPKNSSDRFRRILTPLLTLVTASVCSAQTVAPAKEAPKDEEVLVLTPFAVDASKDKGYYAENTLAGSRLRTNISDLAASISVITKQQLDDTASVDINDVFRYEINTEGSSSYTPGVQTFRSDGVQDVISGANTTGGTNVSTNATANRVRGLGVPSSAINYYPSIGQLPVDSYNIQSLEISRGPNSLLFGLGSPAGIVNQTWAQAVLNRDKYTLQLRTDNYGSFRSNISFNKSLIKDKLAIYGALLYNKAKFARKPSYDDTQRKYGALTFKPFSKTTLRASVETYKNDNRRPNSLTPRDGTTEWRKADEPIYDALTKTITTKSGKVSGPYILNASSPRANEVRAYIEALPGFNAANWNTTGVAKTSYNGISIFGDAAMTNFGTNINGPSNNVLYTPGISIGTQTRSTMRIANGQLQDWFFPTSSQQYRKAWGTVALPASLAPVFPTTGTTLPTDVYNPANNTGGKIWADVFNRYFTQSALTSNNGTNVGGYKYAGVSDKAIYDWSKINVNQSNFGHETNKTYNLEFEQEITHDLFLNAGWFRQDFDSISNYTIGQLNVPTLTVDTSKYLPNGAPNPYVGQVFVEDLDPDQAINAEEDDHYRVMLAYTPDFTKKTGWLKWLGHHQMIGLWSKQDTTRTYLRQRIHITSTGSDAANFRFLANQNNNVDGTPTGWNYQGTSVRRLFYLGGPGDPSGNVARASGEWNARQTNGSIEVYDYDANAFIKQAVTTNFITRSETTGRTQRSIKSLSAGMTSYLWNDRLITTLGVRHDENKARSTTNGAISRQELSKGDPVNDVDITTGRVIAAGQPVGIVLARTAQQNFISGNYETKDLFNRWNRYDVLSGTTRTMGGVLKPFQHWDSIDRQANSGSLLWQFIKDFGVSYNKSDNFNPPDVAQTNAFGVPLAKPTGKGTDYGFQFALMDGKIFARVTWFKSSNQDERAPVGTTIGRLTLNVDQTLFRNWARTIVLINRGRDPTSSTFTTLTTAEDLEVQAAAELIWKLPYNYYRDVAPAIGATRDSEAKGVELQVNYNPTRNWTMKFTGGKQTTVYSNVNREYQEWFDYRDPTWTAAKAADYLLPAYQSLAKYTAFGGRKVDLTNFYSSFGYTPEIRDDEPAGNFNAQLYYNNVVLSQYLLNRDLEGQAAPGQRRYRGSVLTNYTFEGDRLKGFFVGGSQRWESKSIIGYYGKVTGKNLQNPNLLEISDTNRPIYDKANWTTDVWVGYTRKIMNGKVGMRLQLNINDAFQNGGLRVVAVNFDGSPYSYRILDPRQFVLTSSFDF